MMQEDSKYRSRRFILAMLAMLSGVAGMMSGKDVTAFAILAGTVLAGYGFTRSKLVEKPE